MDFKWHHKIKRIDCHKYSCLSINTYFRNGKPELRSNVVVGKVMNQTVIFSAPMKSIVFSPYWNIPKSILNKEIPRYRKLFGRTRYGMAWWLRKTKPGPKNSLGLIKLFPNRMRFIYTTLLQRVYSIEKIEPSVTVVLEWKSPLNWQLRF
jgi:hypothetical protein